MIKHGHLYYKSDKDVFDALHNRKFGKKVITEQLRDRGVLVSIEDNDEDMVEYASLLFLNYHDQQFISETLNSRSQKKNFKSWEITADLPSEDNDDFLKELTKDVKNDLEKEGFDSLDVTKMNDGSYLITTTYTETDYSKSLMTQNLTKSSEVRIWQDAENGIKLRGTEDKKTDLLFDKIQNKIKDVDNSSSVFFIELSSILDSKARSEFFIELIKGIKGFVPTNVKSVSTSTINTPEASEDGDIPPHVNKLLLTGNSVTQSEQFNDLNKAGYFITRIVWSAVQDKPLGDKFEFSAEFKDNRNCRDFSYTPLRFYSCKENGEYNISPNKLPDITISSLLTLIEDSAIIVHRSIVEKYSPLNSTESNNEDD